MVKLFEKTNVMYACTRTTVRHTDKWFILVQYEYNIMQIGSTLIFFCIYIILSQERRHFVERIFDWIRCRVYFRCPVITCRKEHETLAYLNWMKAEKSRRTSSQRVVAKKKNLRRNVSYTDFSVALLINVIFSTLISEVVFTTPSFTHSHSFPFSGGSCMMRA